MILQLTQLNDKDNRVKKILLFIVLPSRHSFTDSGSVECPCCCNDLAEELSMFPSMCQTLKMLDLSLDSVSDKRNRIVLNLEIS